MTTEGPKILIIDDERPIRRFVRISLESSGCQVIEAETGETGLHLAVQKHPDLIILDLELPDTNGIEVLKELRKWSQVPVLFLSVCDEEQEKARALDAGADDYLTKPFGLDELRARIRACLRRGTATVGSICDSVFKAGDLRVDVAHEQAFLGDKEVHLTGTEYRLLTALIKRAGRVVSNAQLLLEVWGPESTFEDQYLRVYVGQLRKKLEADVAHPRYILTEPRVGYRLATN